MIRVVLLSLALLATPVLAQEDHDHEGEHGEEHHDDHGEHAGDDEDHVSEANGVRAVHAWTNATHANQALVFVEIENASDAEVMLVGGKAENADSATLVGFALVDGEPLYAELPGMPVAAGGHVVLGPNGLAIELDGLSEDLHEGESFEMELDFDFGDLDIVVAVEAADATQHSHAGHQH
ncbi:copper chaperone PCu(A)C [Pelagibacterium xiamenense]|uniref:copper chaperone PCu(A)C n=1 Tax=Pelagibacterium xiamenense TaxID=2901140 RepID=UPI001E3AA329|nr:copper chaperone PCu(A)C [Pelagibacterium xiamenense]MCD7059843.1 copper chaperone PCu(A)C [Pelagibacterium xiamenense]